LTVSSIRGSGGAIIGASKIARDIGDRKKAEASLREARDELATANQLLETRVQERTVQLEQANAALLTQMEEDKKLREQLLQAQKLESIGTLAGGIAHDFNNILNIILSYATWLSQNPHDPEKVSENATVISEMVARGAGVVQHLRTLALRLRLNVGRSKLTASSRSCALCSVSSFQGTLRLYYNLIQTFRRLRQT
jgi:C4-dicarboxylate-specific signal transduction histidine kinase